MEVKYGDRETALRALMNMWLKDPAFYCMTCGSENMDNEVCCDKPIIADNVGQYKRFLEEMKELRETRENSYASDKSMSMRFGVSVPIGLYQFLEQSMQRLYQEKLFTKQHDMFWFAKKFPQFKVPYRV